MKWRGALSNFVKLDSSTRQGGIFSPALFAVLSVSVIEMQKMIDVIKNELDYLDISINDTQSVCLRIGKRFNLTTADILIGDKIIVVSHEFKYFG